MMNFGKHSALLILAIALAGCAAPPPLTAEQRKQLEPTVCTSQEQCAMMWQRAQLWLVNNSKWRIQMANDTVIQTFGPGDSTDVAFTVTRNPLGGGNYQVAMHAACGNMFGCVPKSPVTLIAEFNQYMRQ